MIDFHFVHVDASSAKARKRNHQLARAHSARTHRRKRRDELVDITVYDPSELPLVAAKVGKDVEPRKAKWVMERSLSSTPMVSRTVTPVPRRALLGDEVVEMLLSPPPSKTVSPVFGPFAPATFTPSTSLRSEQVAHYLLSVIFHNRLSHAHALARFQSFCEEPMMYHVLHYCVAVFQDLLTGAIAVSRQPEMLWHKAQTIRLLHDSLLRVDESDLEVVICTVMYLTGSDLERHVSASTLLFRAHPGQATWTWIDGQKPPVKAHVDALGTLVAKRGGLLAIEMPGLALSIARSDLVYAALWLAKPRFPCFWSLDDATLAAYQEVQLTASQPAAAGLASIAGMLPFAVLDVLVHVAHTERLLMNHLQVFSLSEQQSEAARCIAHHRLLCLPAWDDTDGIHSEWADETVYECCRLTALLYSTAVILGLPAHVGWHVQLGAQIRRQLEACDVEELSGDAPGLLVWVLTIAAIAAVGSEGQAYFVEALREALGREGLQTRRAAEHVLEGYLWSVETCGEGMARVWEAMGLE